MIKYYYRIHCQFLPVFGARRGNGRNNVSKGSKGSKTWLIRNNRSKIKDIGKEKHIGVKGDRNLNQIQEEISIESIIGNKNQINVSDKLL